MNSDFLMKLALCLFCHIFTYYSSITACISKYSGGCIYSYPSFHTVRNPGLGEKFDSDLRRYLTRKIGFESVMRIRCTRGTEYFFKISSYYIYEVFGDFFCFLFCCYVNIILSFLFKKKKKKFFLSSLEIVTVGTCIFKIKNSY